MNDDVVAYLRAAFGWRGDVALSRGPRGALGQIWRLTADGSRYALKEIFGEPPPPAAIEAELAFTRRAAEAGVPLPASRPDRHGRHLLRTPDGTWVRLYAWVDVRTVEPTAPGLPARLGALLARLHRCAPPAAVEADGGPPDPWYHRVPAETAWAAARAAGTAWAPRLADRLVALPRLCAVVAPPDPADLVVCHRDLHPDNVQADASGALVVLDWDDLGPAAPARELARALFDWFCDGPRADLAAMRVMYRVYVDTGGPGRVREPADLSMLVSSRLNFLHRQVAIAIDPGTERRHREWAEREIAEALRILPTPRQLAQVLELTGRVAP